MYVYTYTIYIYVCVYIFLYINGLTDCTNTSDSSELWTSTVRPLGPLGCKSRLSSGFRIFGSIGCHIQG